MASSFASPRPHAQFALPAIVAARPHTAGFLLLLGVALLLRSAWFGLPLAGYDEGLYLLIGDGLRHGQLPYVETWDRKPPGLFLIYAAIQSLGGKGVLGYQLAATACIAATGLVVTAIVRRHFAWPTAIVCGLLYVVFTGVMGGEAGQSPLFYNLPMALAALFVLQAWPRLATPGGFLKASLAMLLCGFALTVKTTAIFESAYLGLALVIGCVAARLSLPRIAGAALAWMALGILPFALWALIYWQAGQFDAFWFANAESAMLRPNALHAGKGWHQLALTAMALGPLALLAAAGLDKGLAAPGWPRWEARLLAGWLVASVLGFAAVGYFFHHYALPMLVPLAILAARFVEGSKHRTLALALFTLYPVTHQLVLTRILLANDRADMAAILEAIPSRVRTQCMFVYGVPPILYQLTDACRVTRFAFSDHLFAADEAPAIGIDSLAATSAALARRPAVILTDWRSLPANPNLRTLVRVKAELAANYRPLGTHRYRSFENTGHAITIWERRA